MTEHEVFETRLRSALALHVANGPTEFDALAFARAVAAAEPRRRGRRGAMAAAFDAWRADRRPWWSIVVPPAGRSPVFRTAWIMAVAGLLLAMTVSAVFVGSELLRRTEEQPVVPPPMVDLTITAPEGVAAIAWSPDGERLTTVGPDGTARSWDPATGTEQATFRLALRGEGSPPLGVGEFTAAYSPDGTRLAAWTSVHDAVTGAALLTLPGAFMAYSPDGTLIASATDVGWGVFRYHVVDAATGDVHSDVGASSSSTPKAVLAWSPDGTRVARASMASTGTAITVRDATSGTELLAMANRPAVTDLTWSPDGSRIAAAAAYEESRLRNATIYDASTGKVLITLSEFVFGGAATIAFSPDGTRIATGGDDGVATIWDAGTGEALAVLAGRTASVVDLAWSPDGSLIATVSEDGTARIRQVPTGLGPQPRDTPPPADDPDPRALAPVGETTVADTALGTITWQVHTGHAPDVGTTPGPVATEGTELLWLGPAGTVERTTLPVEAQGLLPVGDGLIAYGALQGYGHAQAWPISWNGDRWVVGEELDVPPTLFGSDTTEVRAAAGPRGVLIVGYDVAVAADGRDFITATERPGGNDKLAAKVGPILATDDGFVALVASGQSQFDDGPTFEPIPWFSFDGLAWKPVEDASPFGDGAWVWDVAARDGQFVAVGEFRTAWATWVSDDGRSWELLPEFGLGRDRSCATCPIGVTGSKAGWVISTGKHQSLWASGDGRTWEPLTVPTISIEEGWGTLPPLALGADTIVVVGWLDQEGTASAVGTIEP